MTTTRDEIRPLAVGELETLCRALADTTGGLIGSEIGHVLQECKIADPDPTATKWRRLYNALAGAQNASQSAKPVLNFVHHALAPVRYPGKAVQLHERRASANVALAFVGLQMREDGKFVRVTAATTLKDAEQRANRLRSMLQDRAVHADVITFCKSELLEDNYFHAVQEASKSVAQKIRARTGLTSDGADLVDEAFGGTDPILRLNALTLKSERSEQSGFVNLLKGLFGTFRNPTAHAARVAWPMPEEDALDLFSLASYAHRRIDKALRKP